MTAENIFSGGGAVSLAGSVDKAPGAIVSRVLWKNPSGNLTLFAFDRGQALSEHTAPYDALVQVLEGALTLTVGGREIPAGAEEPCKWLLTLLKAS